MTWDIMCIITTLGNEEGRKEGREEGRRKKERA
jgi:hypothetical protein